jgi:hypothetical protein
MTKQDINYLKRAVKLAKKNNMLKEFERHYRSFNGLKNQLGKPYEVYTKCWSSLYEWDLLEATPTNHGTFTLDF